MTSQSSEKNGISSIFSLTGILMSMVVSNDCSKHNHSVSFQNSFKLSLEF